MFLLGRVTPADNVEHVQLMIWSVAILSFATDHFLVLAVAKSSNGTVATDQLRGCEAQHRNRPNRSTTRLQSLAPQPSQPSQPGNYLRAESSGIIWKQEGVQTTDKRDRQMVAPVLSSPLKGKGRMGFWVGRAQRPLQVHRTLKWRWLQLSLTLNFLWFWFFDFPRTFSQRKKTLSQRYSFGYMKKSISSEILKKNLQSIKITRGHADPNSYCNKP
jgi:hypothetical protein